MPDTELQKLRELAQKATPGPWSTKKPNKDEDGWSVGVCVASAMGNKVYASPPSGQFPANDAAFIAECRTGVPVLLSRLDQKEKRIAELTPYKLAWWLWTKAHSMEEAESFISDAEDLIAANPDKSLGDICGEMFWEGKPFTSTKERLAEAAVDALAAERGRVAKLEDALRTIINRSAEWGANHLGGVAVQTKRWKRLAADAEAALATGERTTP